MKTKQSFTLIEMLIVLVVILILLSFLVPSFKSMQKKSWEIKCKSRLKQISVLMLLYAGDNEDQLPGDLRKDVFYPKTANMTIGWQGHLAPYLVELEKWNLTRTEFMKWREPYQGGTDGPSPLSVFICPTAAYNLDPYFDSIRPDRAVGRYYKSDELGNFDGYWKSIPASYFKPQGPDDGTGNYQTELMYRDASTNGQWWYKARNKKKITMGDIKDASNKVLLVEGFVGATASNYVDADPITFSINDFYHQMTKTLVNGNYGLKAFKLNFLHDDIEEFWFSNSFSYASNAGRPGFMNAIREQYPNENDMRVGNVADKVSILSLVPPASHNFYKGKYYGTNAEWVFPAAKYFYEEEFKFMVGDMNVLFTDMHVDKKSDGWLANNYQYFRQRN